MVPRLILLLPLTLLPLGALADGFPDVSPQPLRSLFSPPDPDMLYMPDTVDVGCEKVCPQRLEPADFPRVKNGRLTLPSRYDLSEFDAHDRALLERALQAAHRYSDVNTAVADGYVFQKEFVPGMGIHMNNLSRILAKEMDAAKPQFLTYARSRDTGAYHLLQVGYLRPRKPEQGNYPLFHAKAAQGHFHPEDWCVSFSSGVFVDSEAPCAPGTTPVGPIWMMHVTPSLYSQDGIFSDYF